MCINKYLFGQIDNQDIYSYVIKNSSGAYAEITEFGCRIVKICVPDREGQLCNVVRSCGSPEEYIDPEHRYDGALVGRCANRIKEGMYLYNNVLYVLTRNEGINHVHGGVVGFHNMLWKCISAKDNEVIFSGFQEHQTEGYPGNMRLTASYKFTEENELHVTVAAQCDRDTVFNPTLHPFFNLNRPGSDASLHFLRINADYYTPTDYQGIPTGEIAPVPKILDFRCARRIIRGLAKEKLYEELICRHGYDHNYVIRRTSRTTRMPEKAAELISVESGRKMEIITSSPGLQFYSGNYMLTPHSAVCLEPQYFPDCINHLGEPGWKPEPVLKAGKLGNYDVAYKFSVITSDEIKELNQEEIANA